MTWLVIGLVIGPILVVAQVGGNDLIVVAGMVSGLGLILDEFVGCLSLAWIEHRGEGIIVHRRSDWRDRLTGAFAIIGNGLRLQFDGHGLDLGFHLLDFPAYGRRKMRE